MTKSLENVDSEIKKEIEQLVEKYPDFWGNINFQVNFKRGSPVNLNVRTEKSIELK